MTLLSYQEGIFLVNSHSLLAVTGCHLFDLTSSITQQFLSPTAMGLKGRELIYFLVLCRTDFTT
jgi:hypothetical protein